MRAKRLILPALVLVMALLGAACGDDDTPTIEGGAGDVPTFEAGTTMALLQEEGKIVVGTKYDQPGLGQINPVTDEVEGFDVEVAKLIAVGIFGGTVEELGDKIEFVEATTPNRELFIENGTVDIVVATYTINDARKQRIDFAGPYYVAVQDILVRADNTDITGVGDLAGKRVCSVLNSTSANNIKEQAPQAELTELETYSLCKDGLLDGRYDAVSTDNVILYGFVAEDPDSLKVVGNPFSEEPYGIGLTRGDDEFRDFLNDRLEEIFASSEWSEAFEATLGQIGVPTPEPPDVDRYPSAGPTTTSAAGDTTTTATGDETTTTTAGDTTTTTAG